MSQPPILDHLRQSILVRLQGITRDLIDVELRAVANEFLSRTLLWRIPYEFVPTIHADAYVIPIPQTGTSMAMLLQASYNGAELFLGDMSHKHVSASDAFGTPRAMMLRDGRTVRLWPAPVTEEHTVKFVAAMTVDIHQAVPEESFVLPFEVVPYTNTIMDGLYARLYAIPERPWTSRILMEHHTRLYRRGLTEARLQADEGRARNVPFLRPNRIL